MPKKILIAMVCVVVALAAAYGSYKLGIWRFNHPAAAEYPVRGIDVSHHRGQIDWQAVRGSGIQFAYIKATEGEDYRDPQFSTNWREAQTSGIARGAYHYFTFGTPGPDQARNFMAAVPREEDALPPVVDFEFAGNSTQRLPKAELLDSLKAFLNTVGDYYGQRPILYVTKDSFAEYLQGQAWAYPVWIRDVFGEPGPVGGQPWVIWQYADNVRISGIKGPVDQNALRGTIQDLLQSTRVAPGG
jgi:lysozyme